MKTITQFKSIECFSTERLIAEKIKSDDLDKLILMHSNPQVMTTLGGLRNTEATKQNLDWNLKQWEENGFGLWLFYLKNDIWNKTGDSVKTLWAGRGGLRKVNIEGHDEIEVGYALMPEFWNMGLATEIANACVEIAFEIKRLDNIVCFTLNTNQASISVMSKAGFKYEKDIILDGLPHVLYRMRNPYKLDQVIR